MYITFKEMLQSGWFYLMRCLYLTSTDSPHIEIVKQFKSQHMSVFQFLSQVILSGRGDAVARARASDIVVGGCEFESRHCHLTGHIPDQLMPGPLIPPQIMPGQG